jgi:hypothetical protein
MARSRFEIFLAAPCAVPPGSAAVKILNGKLRFETGQAALLLPSVPKPDRPAPALPVFAPKVWYSVAPIGGSYEQMLCILKG